MTQVAPEIAIVARARKLLNMSKDGGASENEREMASARFQKLMMEHNISMATVEASSNTSTVSRRKKDKSTGYAAYEWQQGLMRYVAEVNFCVVTTDYSWKRRRYASGYTLVGREENVVSANILFDYLRTSVERLARAHVGGNHLLLMSVAAMSFKQGCASRLRDRLMQRHKAAIAEQRAKAEEARGSSSHALVPFMEDFAEAERCFNEDFRLGLEPGTTAKRQKTYNLKSKAFDVAVDAIRDAKLNDVDDRAIIKQAVDSPISDVFANCGFAPEEVAELMAGAMDLSLIHI